MIKALALFGRRPNWTEADFVAHYLERHAALVAGAASFTRLCARYVQNVRIEDGPEIPFETGPAQQGAVTELWFRSPEHIAKAYASQDYLERVRPDESRFVALDTANVLLCEERKLWTALPDRDPDLAWARAPRIRLFVFRSSREGRAASQVQEAGPSAINRMSNLPGFTSDVRAYSQSFVVPGAAADLPQAADDRTALIEEFSFATIGGAVRFWTAAAADAGLRAFWADWTILSDLPLMLARSHTVFE
jgi:hypothetical protein